MLSRSFYCFTKHSFRQIRPSKLFSKIILSVFVVWTEKGFSEKTSCESKYLFADHRTIRTHHLSERRQYLISVTLTELFF